MQANANPDRVTRNLTDAARNRVLRDKEFEITSTHGVFGGGGWWAITHMGGMWHVPQYSQKLLYPQQERKGNNF